MLNLLKNIESRSFDFLQRRILKIIEKNQVWMVANPSALQWLICQWQTIFYAGRICYGYEGIVKNKQQCEDNLRYEIEKISFVDDDTEEIISEAFSNTTNALTYMDFVMTGHKSDSESGDIGSYTRSDFDEMRDFYNNTMLVDEYYRLCEKPNKTLDELVEIMSDPRYRYYTLYNRNPYARQSVLQGLLSSETNHRFNEDGYMNLDDNGVNGWQQTDIASFPEKIQEVIEQVIYAEHVQEAIALVKEWHKKKAVKRAEKDRRRNMFFLIDIFTKEELDRMSSHEIQLETDKFLRNNENKPFSYTSFNEYSPVTDIPNNAHESYLRGTLEVMNYIIANPELHDKYQVKTAKKTIKQPVLRAYKINSLS